MQSKKTVLITGGNSGIGKETAITFAKNGFRVFITSRNGHRGKEAVTEIISRSGNANVWFICGDLSSVQGSKDLAKQIETNIPAVDVLINNAGITAVEKEINADGFEMSFMVNALAPYILTKSLCSILAKSENPRVLNVSTSYSFLKMARFDPEKSPFGLDYKKGTTYAVSKLAGAMLFSDLAEELKPAGIMVNSFSPGLYKTKNSTQDMKNGFLNLVRNVLMLKSMSLTVAGDAPYYLATDPGLTEVTGCYFNMARKAEFPPNVKDLTQRARLRQNVMEWVS